MNSARLLGTTLLLAACGGGPITQVEVDTPVGHGASLGAPRDTRYAAEAEAEADLIRVVVRERSDCERIGFRVVHRVTETRRDGQVVSRGPVRTVQISEGVKGVESCHERFARGVPVGLRVGAATYRLGTPDARGQVVANVAGELRLGVYADDAPLEATVIVDGREAGVVPLGVYATHAARAAALSADLSALLDRGAELSPADLGRAYELMARLSRLDAAGDPRIAALRVRFLELVGARRADQQTERFRKNLRALSEARGLLAAAPPGLVPPFVASAIGTGGLEPGVVAWARAEVAVALRSSPGACAAGGWPGPAVELAPAARLAFSFLRYAYDDPFLGELRGLCGPAGL